MRLLELKPAYGDGTDCPLPLVCSDPRDETTLGLGSSGPQSAMRGSEDEPTPEGSRAPAIEPSPTASIAAHQPEYERAANHQAGECPRQPATDVRVVQFGAQHQDHNADHDNATN